MRFANKYKEIVHRCKWCQVRCASTADCKLHEQFCAKNRRF
jgi:hypothetical protein